MFGRHKGPVPVNAVFGVSNEILPESYVDRGDLDSVVSRILDRRVHLALNGVSKSGKSWIRLRLIQNELVVHCRLDKTVVDIYKEALGQLGLRLEVDTTHTSDLTGRVQAVGELGIKLLAKVSATGEFSSSATSATTTAPISQDVSNLRFVADLIIASGRRLVIEDFHYLAQAERQRLAFDLKTLWDFGLFIVVVGVWSDRNYLLQLNPDLTGRVVESSIVWSDVDLRRIFEQGGAALNLAFSDELIQRAVHDAYGNAGILQRLIVDTLDNVGIFERPEVLTTVDSLDALEAAGMAYAEELKSVYQSFASRVAAGFRTRTNATGIYAHAMAVILESTDEELINGVSIDKIYAKASAREPRIQKGNLRTALQRIPGMQVDSEGRGLVLSYSDDLIRVVDRQLLLYRKYTTVKWPWEDMIREADANANGFAGEP